MAVTYHITQISSDPRALLEIPRQLKNLLGDSFAIKALLYNELEGLPPIKDDLVLITAPSFTSWVVPFLQPDTKYIVLQRTLNPQHLNRMLELPPGSEVLVVNSFLPSAYELILELLELDLPPNIYFPYDPLAPSPPYRLAAAPELDYCADLKEILSPRTLEQYEKRYPTPPYSGRPFRYAITAGDAAMVPPGIPNIVDLGQRSISILTVAEILHHFTGSATTDDLLMSRYHRDIIKVNMELHKQVRLNKELHQQLADLLDNTDRGLMVVDQYGIITLANQLALEYTERKELVGLEIKDILPAETAACPAFIAINNREFYLDKSILSQITDRSFYLISLESVMKIQDIDHQYRLQQKATGSRAKYTLHHIVHRSGEMKQLIKKAMTFAASDATILISGESGTGKELLAQAIHNASPRRQSPFVAVNCSALTESLLESELFGYEEGAFTGAKKGGKKGLLELAHTGTLFLDEIGDASAAIQMKLLRSLQEKEVLRVGGDRTIPVNLRIIAASHQNLYTLVAEGKFRQDLYYRLSVLPLHVPPLRRRKDDILPLLRYFMNQSRNKNNSLFRLSPEIEELLQEYAWPGNVRELENVVEYMVNTPVSSEEMAGELYRLLYGNANADIAATDSSYSDGSAGSSASPHLSPSPAFPSIAAKEQCYLLLSLLYHAHQEGIRQLSRQQLGVLLAAKGLSLSPQQIKSRVAILTDCAFVESKVGRGTWISEKGLGFCRQELGHS